MKKKNFVPPPQAALFDMDGVLVESIHAWFATVNQALKQLGYPPVTFKRFISDFGQGTRADNERYMQGREKPERLEKLYRGLFERNLFRVKPNPQAGPLLTHLRLRGIKTACVTNSNRKLAQTILKNCGLYPLIDCVVSGSDVPHHKPHPAMVLSALRHLKIEAKRAVMIGDSIFDAQAAAGAKVPFIAYGRDLPGSTARVRRLSSLKKFF